MYFNGTRIGNRSIHLYDHRVSLNFISELRHILLSKLTTSTYWKRDVAQTSRLTLSLQRSCHIWRRISNYLAIKIWESVSSQRYIQNNVHVLPKIRFSWQTGTTTFSINKDWDYTKNPFNTLRWVVDKFVRDPDPNAVLCRHLVLRGILPHNLVIPTLTVSPAVCIHESSKYCALVTRNPANKSLLFDVC